MQSHECHINETIFITHSESSCQIIIFQPLCHWSPFISQCVAQSDYLLATREISLATLYVWKLLLFNIWLGLITLTLHIMSYCDRKPRKIRKTTKQRKKRKTKEREKKINKTKKNKRSSPHTLLQHSIFSQVCLDMNILTTSQPEWAT